MNENSEYWKELLGDDYNDDLMKILQNSSQPGSPAEPPETGKSEGESADDKDEGSRFYNYEPKPAEVPPQKNTDIAPMPPEKDSRKDDKADDFNVDFDFDKEYRDVPDNRPLRKKREKKTGCLGGILYAVFIICLSLLIASLGWLAATDILGLGDEDKQVQVTIPQGFTIDSVTDTLYQNGLIKYKFLFKLYADFSHAESKIAPGTYELNKNYDYRALVYGMSAQTGKRVEVSVTIPEGYTVSKIIQLLDANKVCTEKELWDTATNYDFKYDFLDQKTLGDKHRLEGFLFPDTYKFYVGDKPADVFSKMLDNFKAKFTADYIKRAKDMGYSVRDIVIIASMIEKEAGADSERSLIASVIYNRLQSKSLPYLQIDATINYAIADTGQKFSTDINSPYNTYKVKGLPAGPIANPGLASIKAALYPQSTNYYYYALNKNHTHDFFKDVSSFNAFINSDKYGG